MPITKTGEKINWKEFFERWKLGILQVTELQKINTQIKSTWIMIIGIIMGIVICIINIKTVWWLLIILIAALINTSIQQLSLYQKKIRAE